MLLSNLICISSTLLAVTLALPVNQQETLQISGKTPHSMSLSSINHQKVPGDSPAFYIGDPRNDILSIDSLDLLPNPPVDQLTLRLRGNLHSEIGTRARIKLTVALNGTIGPSADSDLCSQRKIEITQNGQRVCFLRSGPVEMLYSAVIPYTWLAKGDYTVHVEMTTVEGECITNFEGTVWIDGEADDDDGWASKYEKGTE